MAAVVSAVSVAPTPARKISCPAQVIYNFAMRGFAHFNTNLPRMREPADNRKTLRRPRLRRNMRRAVTGRAHSRRASPHSRISMTRAATPARELRLPPPRRDYHRARAPSPPPPSSPALFYAVLPAAAFAALLWLIHLISVYILPAAERSGIFPRSVDGLPGILFAPLLHASFEHLISNTLPLLLLGGGMLYLYPRASKIALPVLYLLPGVGVWLFARDAWHLGASGLSYGIMFFVLVTGFLRKDRGAAGFSMAVLFLYGGMLIGLLPGDSGVSFEYHLFGGLCGVACAFVLHKRDPQAAVQPEKLTDEHEDDPVIGDQWKLPEIRREN